MLFTLPHLQHAARHLFKLSSHITKLHIIIALCTLLSLDCDDNRVERCFEELYDFNFITRNKRVAFPKLNQLTPSTKS